MKWYESKTTNMVHVVAEFPLPRREGFTQCGQPLSNMNEVSRATVRNMPDHVFCLKCYQLAGETGR
jgi:hypothetical protein